MKGFKEYYKNKYVWVFIALAIFYQVLMLGIFLPSYHHADENHAMTIAFIDNDESALSESVIAGIEEALPYEIKDLSKEEAQAAIEDLSLQLLVEIPEGYGDKMLQGDTPEINYYYNGRLATSMLGEVQAVTVQIEQSLAAQARVAQNINILTELGVPYEQAQKMIERTEAPIKHNVEVSDPLPRGLYGSMICMFMPLGAYVFGLMGTAILSMAANENKRRFSQLRLSVYQKIAAIIAALLVPTVGMLINYCFGVELSLLQIAGLWVTVALTAFISVQLSGIFMRFIGDAGTFLNVALLLVQIISSGAILAREQMLGFFSIISVISPMYYAVAAMKNFLFGQGVWSFTLVLALMAVILAVIDLICAHVQDYRKKRYCEQG